MTISTRRELAFAVSLATALLLPASAVHADASMSAHSSHAITAISKTVNGLGLLSSSGNLSIEPWSDRIIHVRFHPQQDWPGNYNPAVIASRQPVPWTSAETADAITLTTSSLQVHIQRTTGAISFRTPEGKIILEEPGHPRRDLPASGRAAVNQAFALNDHDATYGLGQHQGGQLDYRGTTVRLQQANRDVGVPMMVSSGGYGILWNNAAVTEVDVSIPQSAGQLVFRSEAGAGIDYHFIYGPALDGVIAGYRALTGAAPLMPRWTWGLWQSKERYTTQEELLAVARRHRELGVPLDAVVQDWQYWGKDGWGSHAFDPARFPNPGAMVKQLHHMQVHAIVSVWPRFDLATANLAELDAAGAAYPLTYTNVYPEGVGRWYDAYSEAGRAIYWKQIMRNLGTLDFDGWWLDGSEAELGGEWGQLRNVTTAHGPGTEVYNAYPLLHTTAVHDGARRDMPNKRAFILTRSAYAGQQRNAAITWSGDTHGNWDTFRRQIPAGLNFSLSGIPYWSADIGGFFGGDPRDPAYAELFTRWYQFGVFNPMFRVHGTGAGKEIWQFPQATRKVLLDYAKLRYRLLPYIYATSWDVSAHASSMMRPLAMDFREDHAALTIADQYMFGKALLVNPIVQAGATIRTVYLPQGANWFDYWTGAKSAGGQVVAARAGIDTIPVFVRAGSILPLGPARQYADEQSVAPTELRIYPGSNGSFTLYDDEGDGYGYEQGRHATIELRWDDRLHTLTLGARQGTYPGMHSVQQFTVTCGAGQPGSADRVIRYTGSALTVAVPNCR